VVAAGGTVAAGGVVVGGGAVVLAAVVVGVEVATDVGTAIGAEVAGGLVVDARPGVPIALVAVGAGSTARATGAARSSLVIDPAGTLTSPVVVGLAATPRGSFAPATSQPPTASAKSGTSAALIRSPVLPRRLGHGTRWVGQAALLAERRGKRASDG
jgi:hypothetical protein